jgi:hypothetical protein
MNGAGTRAACIGQGGRVSRAICRHVTAMVCVDTTIRAVLRTGMRLGRYEQQRHRKHGDGQRDPVS